MGGEWDGRLKGERRRGEERRGEERRGERGGISGGRILFGVHDMEVLLLLRPYY